MTINKRKKNSRQRGSHTHGWGAMKKHRGAGNRGGSGRAGSGKRGDSKKPSFWKNKEYFGKHGFRSRKKKMESVNASYLEEHLNTLISRNLAKEQAGKFTVNLKDLGYGKLLSKGRLTKKIIVTCGAASKRAIQDIEAAGGRVILPKEEGSNGSEGHTSQST